MKALIKRTLMDFNIRVFTISLVQFLGYRHNIRNIASSAKKGIFILLLTVYRQPEFVPLMYRKWELIT
jgi:hypothetical protein